MSYSDRTKTKFASPEVNELFTQSKVEIVNSTCSKAANDVVAFPETIGVRLINGYLAKVQD